MLRLFRNFIFVCIAASALIWSASAQNKSSVGQVPVTVTVTALGQNFAAAPAIPQEDVAAYSGNARLKVARWVPARVANAGLQLAILIDNDLGPTIAGRQMQDLAEFISAQPPSTSVGVFYAENGTATSLTPFTTDHVAATKALRITAGRQGGSPSIYLSLSDLASHWLPMQDMRREVLVIASGFDPLNPGVEDPYADAAVTDTEKSGIGVHIIMIPSPRYQNSARDNVSEGKLIQATEGTGGQVLFEGAFIPVSISPYLNHLNEALNNQYLLTFDIDRSKKKGGELRPLRVQIEEHGVKLYAPQQFLVPGV